MGGEEEGEEDEGLFKADAVNGGGGGGGRDAFDRRRIIQRNECLPLVITPVHSAHTHNTSFDISQHAQSASSSCADSSPKMPRSQTRTALRLLSAFCTKAQFLASPLSAESCFSRRLRCLGLWKLSGAVRDDALQLCRPSLASRDHPEAPTGLD